MRRFSGNVDAGEKIRAPAVLGFAVPGLSAVF
jgi:hypothetical protein